MIISLTGTKGQAAITDALIFMLIASAAATLLLYVSGIYGASTTKQLFFSYTNEFTQHSLVTLHYLDDADGNRFWLEMKEHLINGDVEQYLRSNYNTIFRPLCSSAGVPCSETDESDLSLCLTAEGAASACYPQFNSNAETEGKSTYTAKVDFELPPRTWTVTLKIAR